MDPQVGQLRLTSLEFNTPALNYHPEPAGKKHRDTVLFLKPICRLYNTDMGIIKYIVPDGVFELVRLKGSTDPLMLLVLLIQVDNIKLHWRLWRQGTATCPECDAAEVCNSGSEQNN